MKSHWLPVGSPPDIRAPIRSRSVAEVLEEGVIHEDPGEDRVGWHDPDTDTNPDTDGNRRSLSTPKISVLTLLRKGLTWLWHWGRTGFD